MNDILLSKNESERVKAVNDFRLNFLDPSVCLKVRVTTKGEICLSYKKSYWIIFSNNKCTCLRSCDTTLVGVTDQEVDDEYRLWSKLPVRHEKEEVEESLPKAYHQLFG